MLVSGDITELSKALNKAQAEMGAVKKESANPFFKSKYADLNSVIAAVKGVLNKHGITVLQTQRVKPINGERDLAILETILVHTSGQYIGSETPIIVAKPNDPQAMGSAISYARRYGLQSLVCLPAEDDDAEGAMVRKSKVKSKGKMEDF